MKLKQINEMFDDVKLGDVRINAHSDYIEYVKIIDGAEYTVELQNDGAANVPSSVAQGHTSRKQLADALGGVWGIDLMGPERFAPTGKGNFAAVYGFLIASLQHAIYTYNINAILWAAFEPGMDLVYNRFVKAFQKSSNPALQFRDIEDGLLISERGLQSLDEETVITLRDLAHNTDAQKSDELKEIRRAKLIRRQFKHWLDKRVKYDGVIWTLSAIDKLNPGVRGTRWDEAGNYQHMFFTPQMLEQIEASNAIQPGDASVVW